MRHYYQKNYQQQISNHALVNINLLIFSSQTHSTFRVFAYLPTFIVLFYPNQTTCSLYSLLCIRNAWICTKVVCTYICIYQVLNLQCVNIHATIKDIYILHLNYFKLPTYYTPSYLNYFEFKIQIQVSCLVDSAIQLRKVGTTRFCLHGKEQLLFRHMLQ